MYNKYALTLLYVLKSAPFLYEAKIVVVAQVNVQWYFYRENSASSTIVLSCKRSDAFFIISAFVRIREITEKKSKQLTNVPTDYFVGHLRPAEIAPKNNTHYWFPLFIFHRPRWQTTVRQCVTVCDLRASYSQIFVTHTHTVRTLLFSGARTKKSKNHTYIYMRACKKIKTIDRRVSHRGIIVMWNKKYAPSAWKISSLVARMSEVYVKRGLSDSRAKARRRTRKCTRVDDIGNRVRSHTAKGERRRW